MLQPLFSLAAAGSFCWFVTSSLVIYPHSLSYFNESVGGPLNGPEHLLGSNVDWGQDLRYLKWWTETSQFSEIDSLYLAYDGFVRPAELGFENALPWPVLADPKMQNQNSGNDHNSLSNNYIFPGSYIISQNLLHGFTRGARDGQFRAVPLSQSTVIRFRQSSPFDQIAYSILTFEVTSQAHFVQVPVGGLVVPDVKLCSSGSSIK